MSIICTCGKASGPTCNGANGCPKRERIEDILLTTGKFTKNEITVLAGAILVLVGLPDPATVTKPNEG